MCNYIIYIYIEAILLYYQITSIRHRNIGAVSVDYTTILALTSSPNHTQIILFFSLIRTLLFVPENVEEEILKVKRLFPDLCGCTHGFIW
jgi:hypothetical protein